MIIRATSYVFLNRFSPLYYLATPQADAGEYLLNGLLNTASTPGAWRLGEYGQDIKNARYFGDAESRKKLWDHTVEATGVAGTEPARTPAS